MQCVTTGAAFRRGPGPVGNAAGARTTLTALCKRVIPDDVHDDGGTMATTEQQAQTGEVIVLKKYGNRRIYDTTSSRYVTLGEVEAMVQQGKDIVVTDARTGEDITKEILVQLLLERDGARAALPMGLLKQAVRLANSPLKEGLVKSLQEGLDTFMQSQRAVVDAQRAFTSQMEKLNPWLQAGTTPVALWNPFAPPAPGASSMASMAPMASAPTPSAPPPAPATAPPASDVDTLRAELAQTQLLVRQLLERELARDDRADRDDTGTAPRKAPRATKASAKKKTTPARRA
jgi:polyhydroxyalkanoate synthesis repressor PhaR